MTVSRKQGTKLGIAIDISRFLMGSLVVGSLENKVSRTRRILGSNPDGSRALLQSVQNDSMNLHFVHNAHSYISALDLSLIGAPTRRVNARRVTHT